MSKRTSFWLALFILLIGATTRLLGLASLPPGMNMDEAQDTQIIELIRLGQVEVLYDVGDEGREGLYHTLVTVITTFIGNHPFGYRMPSVWMSLLTLSLLYALARRLYSVEIGLVAIAAMSVPFWSILLSRTIARETMLPLILTAALVTLTHALPVYRRPGSAAGTLPFGFLGVILGLGFYIHPSHYIVVLVCMVFIAYMILTRQPMSRRTLSYLSFSIVILVIVATPFFISSLRLPELNGTTRLSGEIRLVTESGIWATIANSLSGMFFRGDSNILHNVPHRPYVDPLTGIITIIGLVFTIRQAAQPRYAILLIATVLLFPVGLLVPFSPNFMGYSAILPLLAMLFAVGVQQLLRLTASTAVNKRILPIGVVVLLSLNLLWALYSLHFQWGRDLRVQQAYHQRIFEIANYLDTTIDDTKTVACVADLPTTVPVWRATLDNSVAMLALMMDNPQESSIRYVDCGTGFIIANGGAHYQLILLEPNTLDKTHPYIREWIARGDVITNGLPPESVVSMVVEDDLSNTIGRFTTTAPTGYAPESPGGVAPAQLPVRLSNALAFLGYEQQSAVYDRGGIATSITYWRVDNQLPHDLSLFTHMLFDAETIVSQTDAISVLPDRLQNRDVFVQITFVPIPDSLPAGTYQTSTGAYEQDAQVRLSVLENGSPRGTRLFINEILVQ